MRQFYLYNGMLVVSWMTAFLCGFRRYSILDKPAKFFLGMVLLAFLTDVLAITATFLRMENVVVYNVGSVLYTTAICLYFNLTIAVFRKCRLGEALAILSIVFGIFNSLVLQRFSEPNTFFRIYQMFLIMMLALTKMLIVSLRPDYVSFRDRPHFWVAVSLLFFWTFIFLYIFLYQFLLAYYPSYRNVINWSILVANVVNNLCVALIFYLYPKQSTINEKNP